MCTGGNSYNGASGGSPYGQTDCHGAEIGLESVGSGGGGEYGGAGGSSVIITVGTVSFINSFSATGLNLQF